MALQIEFSVIIHYVYQIDIDIAYRKKSSKAIDDHTINDWEKQTKKKNMNHRWNQNKRLVEYSEEIVVLC